MTLGKTVLSTSDSNLDKEVVEESRSKATVRPIEASSDLAQEDPRLFGADAEGDNEDLDRALPSVRAAVMGKSARLQEDGGDEGDGVSRQIMILIFVKISVKPKVLEYNVVLWRHRRKRSRGIRSVDIALTDPGVRTASVERQIWTHILLVEIRLAMSQSSIAIMLSFGIERETS